MSLFNAPQIFIFRGNHFRFSWPLVTMIAILAFIVFQCSSNNSNPLPTAENKIEVSQEKEEEQEERKEDGGSLLIVDADGHGINKCTLKHTDVFAEISGYIAHVTVKQKFINPLESRIEAVYTFPLDDNAAVNSMSIKHGKHDIKGSIKSREEARKIYEKAVTAGRTAALLEQERSNVFTQSVANIEPGNTVEVTLTYVTLLPYESGEMSFVFPTVVGPRFNANGLTKVPNGSEPMMTTLIQDSMRITPPVVAPRRSGHDISIKVTINSGALIDKIESKLHAISVKHLTHQQSEITLTNLESIPNRDFVLNWRVAGSSLSSSYLTHCKNGDGYVTFMLMPPNRVTPAQIAPRELIFVVDCSGSQQGEPIEKAKETMLYILDRVNEDDAIQIIGFSDSTISAFEKPVQANAKTISKAKKFIHDLNAEGGTFMASAIKQVCSVPADKHRLRIVSFMTDGFVGDDREILELVKKYRGTSRWFPFGTGDSVNRFLIDGIARDGGGEAAYALSSETAEKIAKSFCDKISAPVLTDVKLGFKGLKVKEIYPDVPSDVWSDRPQYFIARYSGASSHVGSVKLTGYAGGKLHEQTIKVSLPKIQIENAAIATIWARKKIEKLSVDDYGPLSVSSECSKQKDVITKLGLKYGILTDYTSFVAVDETTRINNGKSTKVRVPVELPSGCPAGLIGNRGYNETYTGLHTFWGDDIISQLFANIGQLIGKWCTEFINGWLSDAVQFLTGSIKGLGTTEYPTYDGSDTSMRSLIVRGIHETLRIGAFIFLIILVLKQKRKKMVSNPESNESSECESR
jgi:Ca-activated chloride channel homolog